MVSFDSTDGIIEALNNDIQTANSALELPIQQKYKDDTFFKTIRITHF